MLCTVDRVGLVLDINHLIFLRPIDTSAILLAIQCEEMSQGLCHVTSVHNSVALGARAKGLGEAEFSAYVLDPG